MATLHDKPSTIPGSREAKAFVIVLVAAIYAPAFIFFVHAPRPVVLAAAYVLVVGLGLFAAFAYRLMIAGTAPVPGNTFAAGAAFIAGGAGFDIFATLSHSPDLRLETNPFARFLLDSGRSVPFVLVYGALCQTLLAIGSILLWRGLLSHRATIIDSIRESSRSFPGFMKAILGGAKVTWKQWIIPWRRYRGDRSEKYFYYPWPIAAMLVGAAAYRWYLGLEWFGFAPGNRVVVAISSMVLGLAVYFSWAWHAVRRSGRESHQ
jgi:hypothetical protein